MESAQAPDDSSDLLLIDRGAAFYEHFANDIRRGYAAMG
jgi:hypothetical protein